jgi:hypothetical protein
MLSHALAERAQCAALFRRERRKAGKLEHEGRAACRFDELQPTAIAFGEFARDDEADSIAAG